MKSWCSGRGLWIVATGLLVAVVGVRAGAQQTKTPTLPEILQRLQENLDQYKALVPSFFCDEHVVSTIIPDPRHESRVTDSTFRLKRVANPEVEGKTILEESHEVKMVNGKPSTGDSVGGPAYLRGAFSNGLALVSLSQQACMSYTLRPIRQNHPKDPTVVQFASVPAGKRPDGCRMQEDVSGRVQIDPESMQVTHLEFTAPRHLIGTAAAPANTLFLEPGFDMQSIVGRWDVTVEYAPVLLGGKSFWLPTKISDRMRSSLVPNRWTYDATYSNYHKLEVTSRILPGSEVPVP